MESKFSGDPSELPFEILWEQAKKEGEKDRETKRTLLAEIGKGAEARFVVEFIGKLLKINPDSKRAANLMGKFKLIYSSSNMETDEEAKIKERNSSLKENWRIVHRSLAEFRLLGERDSGITVDDAKNMTSELNEILGPFDKEMDEELRDLIKSGRLEPYAQKTMEK